MYKSYLCPFLSPICCTVTPAKNFVFDFFFFMNDLSINNMMLTTISLFFPFVMHEHELLPIHAVVVTNERKKIILKFATF